MDRPKVGMGYRVSMHNEIVEQLEHIEVLEITLDHYFAATSRQVELFKSLTELHPLISHGVGLSLGTDEPVDDRYLDQISSAIEILGVPFYSEHLAFTRASGMELAELLPLPRTEKVAEFLIEKIRKIQSHLPVPLALENITYYFEFPNAETTDAEFFSLICRETGVDVLLDIENLYVNSINHGADPHHFIESLPQDSVIEMHIAGGKKVGDILVDTHGHQVVAPVLDLIHHVFTRQSPKYVILERDDRLDQIDEIQVDLDNIHESVSASLAKING